MTFIVYTITLLLAAVAAARPVWGVVLVLALTPWGGVEVNVGATMLPAEFVALVTVVVGIAVRRGRFELPSWAGYMLAFLLLSCVVGLINLIDGTPYQASGSALQNGVGRIATQLVKWLIWIFFALHIWSVRDRLHPARVLRTYLMSMVLLAALGLLQFFVYRYIGFDLFPISGVEGNTAFLAEKIRITSFAGEPKRFASSLVTAIVLMIALGDLVPLRTWVRRSMIGLFITCLLLTASSSGFFALAAGGGVLLMTLNQRVPFKSPATWTIATLAFLSVALLYFTVASVGDLMAPQMQHPVESLLDIVRFQTLERLRLDDTDAIYLAFLADHPGRLLLGIGLGLGHHEAMGYIPPLQQYYMWGTVMPAKSGVVEALVASGLLGLLLFASAMSLLVVPGGRWSRFGPRASLRLQSAGLALIVVVAMRNYDIFTILCLLTLLRIIDVRPTVLGTGGHRLTRAF